MSSGNDFPFLFPELAKDLQSLSFTTGLFPSQKIRELVQDGRISSDGTIAEAQIQPSSLDLRLGGTAYRVQASLLPGRNGTVDGKLKDLIMAKIDLSHPTVFEKGCVYIVPLMEQLILPVDVSAKANPKSTTGRLDMFTRLICDGVNEFDRVPEGYKGRLYAEVVPRTFSVIVRSGVRLNQLRFLRGRPRPSDADLEKLDEQESLAYSTVSSVFQQGHEEAPITPEINNGLRISINLEGDKASRVVGYKAKKNTPAIDVLREAYYDPEDFWDVIKASHKRSLILNPDDFHILFSKQKVRIPPSHAAELVAYDPSIGEFRIHYAGFFDPGFGYGSNDIKGTNAVLEVRSHEVPFLMEDDQIVGRLIYERLLGAPDKLYGCLIGSSYQSQGLALSKQFKRSNQYAQEVT